MAGTVKLSVPELAGLVSDGELVACEEFFGCAEAVAVPEESAMAKGSAAASCVGRRRG
jgi:hypothetical protein